MNGKGPPAQLPVLKDLNDAQQIRCKCKKTIFIPVIKLYKISAMLFQTNKPGKDDTLQIQVWQCQKCKRILGDETDTR